MSENIKVYDLLMRERGQDFGSLLSIIRCANELANLGYTVYVGVTDLTIPEMKHIVYGYYDGFPSCTTNLIEPKTPMNPSIFFFNGYRIKNNEYCKTFRGISVCERVAIIASAYVIKHLETYDLLVKQPELAVIVKEWDGVVPKRSEDIMNWVLDDSGITLYNLTQRDKPSTVFMDIFQYGITLLTTGLLNEVDCKETLILASKIHDSFANKPRITLAEKKKIFMKHDVTKDILLIEIQNNQ